MNAPTTPAPNGPTVYELQEQIRHLERERMTIPKFDLPALEEKIQFHSARVHTGSLEQIGKHKADLLMYLNMKDAATAHLERITEINSQIARLNADLALARDLDKWQQAGDASRLCDEAYAEYVAASKQTARAFRRLLMANNAASVIPQAIPRPADATLHLPAIWPQGWQPPLGLAMLGALLPFEQSEQREAAQ